VRLLHGPQSKKKPKKKPAPGDCSANHRSAALTAKYAATSTDRLIHHSPGDGLSNCCISKVFQFLLTRLLDLSRKKSSTEQSSNNCLAFSWRRRHGIPAGILRVVWQSSNRSSLPDSSSFHPFLCISSLLVGNKVLFTPSLSPNPLSFFPSHSSTKLASSVKESSSGFSKLRLRFVPINLDAEQASRP